MTHSRPFSDPKVETVFKGFAKPEQDVLRALRHLIFETAETLPDVGLIEETLKWGQPSYLTPQTKSGSTLRLGVLKQGGVAIYAHCQTTIVSDFRALFPDDFGYDGNRGVLLPDKPDIPFDKLRLLVTSGLTYHLQKRLYDD